MPVERTRTRRGGRAPRLVLAVQYGCGRRGLPSVPSIRRWLGACLVKPGTITVRFVDESEGRQLNLAYRGKDYPTNVLSFPYSSSADPEVFGDLALCGTVVQREATDQAKSVRAHCAHLLVHGGLHLQGYDHETDAQAMVMEQRERDILAAFGIADPYAAPGSFHLD